MTLRITPESPTWVRWTVDADTGCWVWAGHADRSGYGRCGGGELAHRRIWTDVNGPVPDGMQLDHLCRNRRCVNPDHLEVVTQAENIRRGFAARGFGSTCQRGHSLDDAYVEPGTGRRKCRECRRRWALDWYYRQARKVAS